MQLHAGLSTVWICHTCGYLSIPQIRPDLRKEHYRIPSDRISPPHIYTPCSSLASKLHVLPDHSVSAKSRPTHDHTSCRHLGNQDTRCAHWDCNQLIGRRLLTHTTPHHRLSTHWRGPLSGQCSASAPQRLSRSRRSLCRHVADCYRVPVHG